MIADVAALPRNDQLAEQFELLADLLELDAVDSFRVNAYRRAAARIRETPASVAQLALDGKAKGLQGIGKTIEGKIVEVIDDGEIHALDEAQGRGAARGGDLHAAAGARAEDGPPDLAGARDHHGGDAQGRRRGG